MKTSVRTIISSFLPLFFLVIILLLGSFKTGWCGQNIRYIIGNDNKPFVFHDAEGKLIGFDIEVLRAVFKGSGSKLKVTKKIVPWKRTLKMIEKGETDLLLSASHTNERAKYAYFELPYRAEYLALYIRMGDGNKFKLNKVEDLLSSKMVIAANMGSTYGPRTDKVMKKMGKRVQYMSGGNPEIKNRKKMIIGRVDGYFSYPTTESFSLKTLGLADKIQVHPMPQINTGDIYMMMSKKSVSYDTIKALKKNLKKIKANGTYDRIAKKYSKMFGIAQW